MYPKSSFRLKRERAGPRKWDPGLSMASAAGRSVAWEKALCTLGCSILGGELGGGGCDLQHSQVGFTSSLALLQLISPASMEAP